MARSEQTVESRPVKPNDLILNAIDKYLAHVVTCTLPAEEVQGRKQAFVEALMSNPRIEKRDLVNFLKEAILSGEPIVDPNQHVSPFQPPQAGRRPYNL